SRPLPTRARMRYRGGYLTKVRVTRSEPSPKVASVIRTVAMPVPFWIVPTSGVVNVARPAASVNSSFEIGARPGIWSVKNAGDPTNGSPDGSVTRTESCSELGWCETEIVYSDELSRTRISVEP